MRPGTERSEADLSALAEAIDGNAGWWAVPVTLEGLFTPTGAGAAAAAPLARAVLRTCPFSDGLAKAIVSSVGSGMLDPDLAALRGPKVLQLTFECSHGEKHVGSTTYHAGWERPYRGRAPRA